MIEVTKDQLLQLAPRAKQRYLDAFGCADSVLSARGVNHNPLRVAHFIAQVMHETGGLSILTESLNYRAARIVEVWPSRFKTVADAQLYERNPQKLANKVYGGRMGNTGPNDGWLYIGRGLIMMTGKESYTRAGKALGIDLVANPDLAIDPRYMLAIAAEEWERTGCNEKADRDDISAVTKAINGGYIGLTNRQMWLMKTKTIWKENV